MSARNNPSFFAALWLPQFQLQAVLRGKDAITHASSLCGPAGILPAGFDAYDSNARRQDACGTAQPGWLSYQNLPIAVLDCEEQSTSETEKNKCLVLHANEAAQRHHVAAGMTPSQAQARCVALKILCRSAEAETAAHQLLLECAGQWTPDYESSQPGVCVLDLSHVRDAAKQAESFGHQMRQWLEGAGLEGRIGLASHPDLACLAARAANRVLVLWEASGSEEDLLAQLPMAALQPSAAIAQVLALWGVESLAQFAALRREDIAARLGAEGALLWDVVRGGRERLLRLVRPPADFAERFEFEHPVEMMEPLLFVLRRMLGDLCQYLANAWLVASAMRLRLLFEDQQVYEKTLRVAEPTRDADLLLRVLHTHLEGRSASAPIVEVGVELMAVRPVNLQTNLFERRLRDPNQFSETLARLEALLGRGNVGRVELLPSRRPDAFAVVNYLEGVNGQRLDRGQRSTVNGQVSEYGTRSRAERDRLRSCPKGEPEWRVNMSKPCGLPLWRFRPPQVVEVVVRDGRPEMIHAPAGSQAITEAKGPWLMSGDWWDRHGWAREVWEVSTVNGALYQLAWEKNGGWVLDGTFG